MTDFTPCSKTIRLCIEALPEPPDGMDLDVLDYYGLAAATLEVLLPDEAEELFKSLCDPNEAMGPSFGAGMIEACRRLINQGKVRP